MRRILSLIGILAAMTASAGCKVGTLATSAQALKGEEDAGSKTEVTESGGTVTALVKKGAEANIQASSKSDISSAQVYVPTGALSVNTEISMEEGQSLLADREEAAMLVGDTEESGRAVVVQPSEEVNPTVALSIQIPSPDGLGLALAGSDERLVVIYRIRDFSKNGEIRAGVLPRKLLKIEGGNVVFDTLFFGSFQAVITRTVVAKAKEQRSHKGIRSQNGKLMAEATPPPPAEDPFVAAKAEEAAAEEDETASSDDDSFGQDVQDLLAQALGEDASDATSALEDASDDLEDAAAAAAASQSASGNGGEGSPPNLLTFAAIADPADVHGRIVVSAAFPLDTSDYASLQIWRASGENAPDCGSGIKVHDSTQGYDAPLTVNDDTGAIYGEKFSYTACISDADGNVSTDKVEAVRAADTEEPPPFNFSATNAGMAHGDILLDANFPSVSPDYDRVELLSQPGGTPPDCDEGTLEVTLSSFEGATHVHATGANYGEPYSYRACAYDAAGNVTSHTVSNVPARDTMDPPSFAFSASPSSMHGKIALSVDLPSNVSDYTAINVYRLPGSSPPGCFGGTLAHTFASFSPNGNLAYEDYTAAQHGEKYSYRLCAMDGQGNMTEVTASNVRTGDAVDPPSLVSFTAVTGGTSEGDIDIAWTYPGDLADYNVFEIRYQAGSTAPGCYSGSVAMSLSSFGSTSLVWGTGSTTGDEHSLTACIIDASGNLQPSHSVTGVAARDTTAPTALTGYSVATGTGSDGDIAITLNYPADVADYDGVKIVRLKGGTLPNADCTSDGNVIVEPSFSASGTYNYTDATGSWTGDEYSYRVCIWDSSFNMISGFTAAGIPARDTNAPGSLAAFSAVPGGAHGKVAVSFTTPSVIDDYDEVKIRRLDSPNAPHADCTSDGTEIYSNGAVAPSTAYNFDDATPANNGEPHGYRFCLYDSSGNLNSSAMLTNVPAQDLQGPPAMVAFSAAPGSGMGAVDLTLDYPSNVSEFDEMKIRRVQGSTAPDANCLDGDLVYDTNAAFTDITIVDSGTGGQAYSYRACAYDINDNITTATHTNVVATAAAHRIFVTGAKWKGSEIGGLAGADAKCQTAADGESLGGTWKAIISTAATDAKDHIAIISSVENINGQAMANDEADLWDGTVAAKPWYDESGTLVAHDAWTGTDSDGTEYGSDCNGWSGGTGTSFTGDSSRTDGGWMRFAGENCNSGTYTNALYCIDGQ